MLRLKNTDIANTFYKKAARRKGSQRSRIVEEGLAMNLRSGLAPEKWLV